MSLVISECKPDLSEEGLNAVELKFGIMLPAQYRKFILIHNGGFPTPSKFEFIGSKGRKENSTVHYFLSIYDGRYSNFEYHYQDFKIQSRRVPDELVPIAYDSFGNLVCIAVKGEHTGAVYFWDHENEAPGEIPWSKNVHLIQPTFEKFLESLH